MSAAQLATKQAERAALTPRQIHDRLLADPASVRMDELQRLVALGGRFAAAANAEIGHRDGPAAIWPVRVTSSARP